MQAQLEVKGACVDDQIWQGWKNRTAQFAKSDITPQNFKFWNMTKIH
jgi:hypothetical protein